MGVYDEDATAALSLITESGAAAAITRTVAPTRDPVTNAESGGSVTTAKFPVVGLPGRDITRPGTAQQQYERRFYIALPALSPFIPENGDTIAWDGRTYGLQNTQPLAPNNGRVILVTADANTI